MTDFIADNVSLEGLIHIHVHVHVYVPDDDAGANASVDNQEDVASSS